MAAFLVNAGKRPYADFCFPQAPLHVYWNALWLRLLGDSWRGPQAIAALLTCGAIITVAEYVYRRRTSQLEACVAGLFVGLNSIVVEFGTKAQAYGAGLFLTVAAFRFSVASPRIALSALAGLFAGASADCTLLTAPGAVVLFAWTAWRRRFLHVLAFIGGALVGGLPAILSFVRFPSLTWFNLVTYHVLFRQAGWGGTGEQDWGVITSFVDSGQALLLGLFAIAGLVLVRNLEFQLAAALAVAVGWEAASAHPTFPQYFVFLVPLLAIPAASGFRCVADRIHLRPSFAVAGLIAVLGLALSNSLISFAGDNTDWDNIAALARKVKDVTPDHAPVLADPPVYFAMHAIPPEGSNFPASHRMEVSLDQAARLHIVPQSLLERQVKDGMFATVETCRGDEDEMEALELPKHYAHSVTMKDCQVYWGFRPQTPN